ncbi:MAG: HEPN domain-containing protein [Desulfobacteraceae bacterium]|nr:HEPN domain-containing protein [Desulfobacteraceae bacterium]
MILKKELKKLAKARLKDSEILFRNRRYDSAIYLCGYAVELALKARICRALKWMDFPSSNREFSDYKSLKTHNLDALLTFSGVEGKIKSNFFFEWSVVTQWKPEDRYRPLGTANRITANDMINATERLIMALR